MVQGMGLGGSDNNQRRKKNENKTESKSRGSKTSKQSNKPLSVKSPKKRPQSKSNVKKKKNSGKLILGFMVLIILIIGVFIGVSYFLGGSENDLKSIEFNLENVDIPDNPSSTDVEVIRSTANDHMMFNPFSRAGLLEQMVIEGFNQDVTADVINELDINWMEKAVLAGERYVNYLAPDATEDGMVDQLTYEAFTPGEINHAIESLDLEFLNEFYSPNEDSEDLSNEQDEVVDEELDESEDEE